MKRKIGSRVKILGGGMREFAGKLGTVIGHEHEYYRVRLDEPAYVEGVGEVTDDLWTGAMLKTVRK
jgi:hypothetical protein